MFDDFESKRITTSETEIHLLRCGDGEPLLVLHGYPQNHVCWHKGAPSLAKHFYLVIPDFRGYGDIGCPAPDSAHTTFSKRAIAKDMVEVMATLGFNQFYSL